MRRVYHGFLTSSVALRTAPSNSSSVSSLVLRTVSGSANPSLSIFMLLWMRVNKQRKLIIYGAKCGQTSNSFKAKIMKPIAKKQY